MVRTRVTAALNGVGLGRRMRASGPPEQQTPVGRSAAELDGQACDLLVQTDDAIRTSEQELAFAAARLGERAAAPFAAALDSARADLAAAFRLRQLLDEDCQEDATARRSQLGEITARCAQASRVLDDHAEAFDRLQDLPARVPKLLAEVDAHVARQTARVGASRQVLARLAATYTAQAVGTVAANPDEAAGRLTFASAVVAGARSELGASRVGTVAATLQAAEAATDQAADLLTAVEHTAAGLTQAASALPAALREVGAEIADARTLLAGRACDERAGLAARADEVATAARAQRTAGAFDALSALRDVQRADSALGHALAGHRAQPERQVRARAVLDQAMLVARTSVRAARDFVTARRGGVGARARTRQAEAHRHFQQAIDLVRDDPEAAVAEAQQADALALRGSVLAAQDIARFGADQQDRAPGCGDATTAFGGTILGGILIDCGHGGRMGLASFGGAATRARHRFDASAGAAAQPLR
jgi:tetratricopeptide (TPR) repeat protein